MTSPVLEVPSHVPADLVFDYDMFDTPASFESPQWGIAELLHSKAPAIFFTPRNGGHWVVTRVADAVEMLRDPEHFPNNPEFNWHRKQNPIRLFPEDYDPPEHADARKLLAPLFVPEAIHKMESSIRLLARELIDEVRGRGSCEFVRDIAERFPVTVFLQMANGPLEDRERLVEMSKKYFRAPDPDEAKAGMRDLADFLTGLIEDRQKNPGNDMVSLIATGTMLGRPLTKDEMLGATVFMFLAGLDTVTAMLSFVMKFLAGSPDVYEPFVKDPARIAGAIEELIRVSGVAMPERGVRNDTTFKGVRFKQFDRIMFPLQISGMDDQRIDEPFKVDFGRKVSSHIVFSSGPHRCLGSHLARLEIRVFLEEWAARIPRFRIKTGASIRVQGGRVWLPAALPLEWDAPSTGPRH